MPLIGNIKGLAAHAKRMAGLANGALLKKEAGLLEDARWALQQTTQECFFLQRAPDGTPWAERKTKYYSYRDSNPILFNLLATMQFTIKDHGIHVGFPEGDERQKYGMYHQTGTAIMPARPFLVTKHVSATLRNFMIQAGAKASRRVVSGAGVIQGAIGLAREGFLG